MAVATNAALRVRYLAPGEITPAPRNARTHSPAQVQQIARSIGSPAQRPRWKLTAALSPTLPPSALSRRLSVSDAHPEMNAPPVVPASCTVYGLVSSEAPTTIRYVGQTIRSLDKRLREHITLAARTNFPVNRWVRKVLAAGHTISFIELELNATPGEAEVRWIAKLRSEGLRLVNATSGGPGVLSPSAATREKLAAGKRGIPKSAIHRAKLRAVQTATPSLGFKGHSHTEEAKLRFSRLGRKDTAEGRANKSAAGTGRKHTAATRAKIWVVRRQRAAERAVVETNGLMP